MIRILRLIAFGLVSLASTAAVAQGLGLSPLADRFATCTGRFAALMEHQWMADDPATGETAAMLDTLRGLLDAVTEPGQSGLVLARESEAKLAFERLLARAEDEGDPTEAAWAAARAEAEIATCTALMLP